MPPKKNMKKIDSTKITTCILYIYPCFIFVLQAFQISNLIREYIEVLRTGVGCASNGDLRHVAQLVAVAGGDRGSCANGGSAVAGGTTALGGNSDQLAFG